MKRMKKKVVAMVTLAMFMLTLVPMAAFAGTENKLTAKATEVETGTAVDVVVSLDGAKASALDVWVEDTDGNIETNAVIAKGTGIDQAPETADGIAHFEGVDDNDEVKVTFNAAGKYTVHAGRYVVQPGGSVEFTEFAAPTKVITVKGPECTNLTVAKATVSVDNKNGIERTPFTVTVTPKSASLDGSYVTVENVYESRGLKIVDENGKEISKAKVANKEAKFYVTAQDYTPAGDYKMTVACNGFELKDALVVTVEGKDSTDPKAATITALPVEKVITNDKLNAVKFELKNAAGELVVPSDEPIVKDPITTTGSYVEVVKQPDGVELDPDQLKLVKDADSDLMVLTYNTPDDVKPGDYSIKFTLKNGQTATTNFTVDAFDEIVDLKIVAKDEIALNDKGVGTTNFEVVAVDKNDIERPANITFVSYEPATNNTSVNVKDIPGGENNDRTLTVEPNAAVGAEKEDILGTKVKVLVVAENKTATKEFTLVDTVSSGWADYELVFDETEGTVLNNNVVTPSIVKKDDKKVVKDVDQLYVNLVSQSNKDAKVDVQETTNSKGKKAIQIYSDKDTTVEVQVIARVNGAFAAYADTLTYTIGEKAAEAEETTVVMTFGSTEMIVNNKVVDMKDAAPFAQDNRTFVPFRALGEKVLGATVTYNEADKTVTYELEGNKIVMTLDSKTYTVNGAEKTMDVAPFAKDGRTYVPVRFVGEALGFTVTGLTNGAGEYVGVAFTK